MEDLAPLRWHDGGLEILDQRALPAEERWIRAESAASVAEAIRSMAVRGAPAIGCAAAFALALEARRLRGEPAQERRAALERAAALLAATRPTARNLFWALARMQRAWEGEAGPADLAARLYAEARRILAEEESASHAISAAGAALLAPRARVLTHCNTGALAAAGRGTALGVVRAAFEEGKEPSVIVCETRPLLQGARLTAWELRRAGVPATLIADGAAGALLSRGEVDAVLVGADRVAANGDVANKIGTYPLAVLARRHGVPFYVACPLSTLDLSLPSGAAIPIEERPPDEVAGFGAVRWAPHGVAIRNPAFDVSPAELVTALVTEKGVVAAPDPVKIRALLAS